MAQPENPIEDFRAAVAATLRALGHAPGVDLAYTADKPSFHGDQARVPQPGRALPPEQVAEVRGWADSFALRQLHHDPKLHGVDQPDAGLARDIWNAVEQARVEALGSAELMGVAKNLDRMTEMRVRADPIVRARTAEEVPLATAMGLLVRERLTGQPVPKIAEAAMELARLAGILPAFLVDPDPAGEVQAVGAADLAGWKDTSNLTVAARARLPVSAHDEAEIVAFRSADDLREHVALVIGRQSGDRAPLVRLHSECLTGDILGSLKCDCGPQLDSALAAMASEAEAGGWGVLLYLRQEGRGIGLINKLRAYRLQDQGFDTVDANNRLGLPTEARDFPVAARMLALLGVRRVRLMTNNPGKVAALETEGVEVVERVPHQLPANPHNARYLDTKRDRSGHLL